jgi:hypothetical protein
MRAGAPLPPICVFCGETAVAGVRNAIKTRGAFQSLQIMSARIPMCEDDRRRYRAVMHRPNLTFVVVLVSVLVLKKVPGVYGLFPFDPYGQMPGVRLVVLALATFLVVHVVHRFLRRRAGPPRPVRLRFVRSQGGFIWLADADPRCLSQLPAVAAGR